MLYDVDSLFLECSFFHERPNEKLTQTLGFLKAEFIELLILLSAKLNSDTFCTYTYTKKKKNIRKK